MNQIDLLWLFPALACYAASAGLFAFSRYAERTGPQRYAVWLLAAGAALHGFDLVIRGVHVGNIPVATFAQSLSFLAWITALAGLLLIVRVGMTAIGTYVTAAVTIAFGAATALMKQGRFVLPAALQSAWLPIHVTLAILGYALFVLAASVSLVYLAYESRLKAKRPMGEGAGRGVSLEKLDRINFHLLAWGFLALSLAIVSGAIWADATWGHFWSWDPKESWSLVIWILYASLLESRLAAGWRGRRAAALTVVAFVVLVGSLVGVTLVFPGKHGGNFG
jgi:cytochrome c-type biogenesis protein CcsB